MSKERTETITCPDCGKKSEFTIWESINTMVDPQTKSAVRDLSLFQFTCPNCGSQTFINYGFLYHQMEDKIMIQYAPTEEYAEQFKKQIEFFRSGDLPAVMRSVLSDNYLLRIVRSINEFQEKLSIFDAGLDDRIVEMYKIMILPLVFKQVPEPEEAEMFFERIGGKDYIQVVVKGKVFGGAEIDADMYKILEESSAGTIPDLRNDELIIDRNYAFKAMESIAKNLDNNLFK